MTQPVPFDKRRQKTAFTSSGELLQQAVKAMEPPEPGREFRAALLEVQKRIQTVGKDRTAKTGTYSYSYGSLPAIMEMLRPILADNNLILSHEVDNTCATQGDRYLFEVTVRTVVTHVNGCSLHVAITSMLADGKPQTLGSGITYLKRYGVTTLFAIVTDDEDDDGQAANGSKGSTAPKPQSQAPAERRPTVDPSGIVSVDDPALTATDKALLRHWDMKFGKATSVDLLRENVEELKKVFPDGEGDAPRHILRSTIEMMFAKREKTLRDQERD